MTRTIFLLPALLALAACDGGTQGADVTTEEAAANGDLAANNSVAPVEPDDAGTPAPTEIPEAMRGRWGLVAADCTSTRGDAKGLLEIGPDSLKLYESRAVPGTSIETDHQGISGNFNFTGEGQTWSKYVSLKLQGEVLTRTDRNPVASYNYARC